MREGCKFLLISLVVYSPTILTLLLAGYLALLVLGALSTP